MISLLSSLACLACFLTFTSPAVIRLTLSGPINSSSTLKRSVQYLSTEYRVQSTEYYFRVQIHYTLSGVIIHLYNDSIKTKVTTVET